MGQFVDLTGRRFGRLRVVRRATLPGEGSRIGWLCRCDCGRISTVKGNKLSHGVTKSCGCLSVELSHRRLRSFQFKHGKRYTPEYEAWAQMVTRCTNPKSKKWKDYGGRGLTVCRRWLNSFSNFYSDMGPRPAGTSLDREKNDKGYSPSNCRWATAHQQQNNRRNNRTVTYEGLTLTMTQWARKQGINVQTLRSRLNAGWDAATSLRRI